MERRRIVVLDADQRFIDLLQTLVKYETGVVFINTYNQCTDLLKHLNSDKPDYIIADLDYYGDEGLVMLNQIKKVNRMIHIILLTERREDQWILKLVSQSISAILLKNDCIASIVKTIETIEQGGLPIDPFISRIVFTMMQASDDNSKLTMQEKRILKLLGRGMTSQVIANELGITPATSRTHLKNIYKKLQVNSKTQALRKAKECR